MDPSYTLNSEGGGIRATLFNFKYFTIAIVHLNVFLSHLFDIFLFSLWIELAKGGEAREKALWKRVYAVR